MLVRIYLISFLSFVMSQIGAQDSLIYKEAHFDRYSVAEGLYANEILCTAQDHQGYIWIGGVGGLYRFDGNEFFHFGTSESDSFSLQASIVTYIYEDSRHQIWIATSNGGLKRLDRTRGQFSHFMFDPNNKKSISSNGVIRMLEDGTGNFWVGTDHGLHLMDRETGDFEKIDPPDSIPEFHWKFSYFKHGPFAGW